jgi:polyhydroxybutyrate depolymerase
VPTRRSVAATLMLAIGLASCSSTTTTVPPGDGTGTTESRSGCGEPDEAFARVGENGVFVSDGEERQFGLEVPPDARADEPLPLVVGMHGVGSTSETFEASARFHDLAREERFVVVTPQARGASRVWALDPSDQDVRFVEDLIDEVQAKLCIDEDRIYLTGFSMGGMMSTVLACVEPDRYAAIAPVAGLIQVDDCDTATPVPLLAMHGTADDAVRYDGTFAPSVGFLAGREVGPPRTAIAASWAQRNGCDPEAVTTTIEPDVEHLTYTCPPDGSVELYVVEDGGHTWPGSETTPAIDAQAGKTTQAIDGTRVIWDFFREHSRSG